MYVPIISIHVYVPIISKPYLRLHSFLLFSLHAGDVLLLLPQLLVVLLKRGLIRSYHTKSSKVQEEKHIPTSHIERINGTEKLTMEWSWLFRCHLGVAQSYSKIFRGICHEPWVDS